ncbi:MAG: hypothetical protein LBQ69_04355 [Treponema sp.]|nr:hypothetical protein [Treponema sp.]
MLLPATYLSAQHGDQPRITVQGTPNRPVAGSAWTLTLLVAHSEPNEVEVLVPHFTDAIFLEQILKGPRLKNSATGQTYAGYPQQSEEAAFERWTAIEYRFTLISAGAVSFDAFTVVTPRWQESTAPFSLWVQQSPDIADTRHYRLAWEQLPPVLQTGESAVFSLRVSRWDSASALPEAQMFLPPVPQGCILEALPVADEERQKGIALRLRVIPLEATPFALGRRQISHNGSVFEIPALRIPVSAAKRVAPNAPANPAETAQAHSSHPPPFPSLQVLAEGNSRLYQRHRAECEAIYNTAKGLWERGEFAAALATLRQNERDHRAGSTFTAVRREAERSISLTGTSDEKRQNLLSFLGGNSRSAVLRETAVYLIPDPAGEPIGRFGEGQPVLVSPGTPTGRGERWLRVTANDSSGISGWVPEERIIFF